MRLELFSVGTELLLGEILDTNAAYLADKLSELGINVFYKTTVGDNIARLAAALTIALQRADTVLATGGLGPTQDDITAAAIADVTGLPLEEDPASADHIRDVVRRRGHKWLDSLLKQARLPRGAIAVPNPVGTAPGFILRTGGKAIIALPGPPSEMKPMFEGVVYPYLAEQVAGQGGGVLVSRVLRFTGIGESQIEAELRDLISAQTNPTIAPLAKATEVHIRITARASDRAAATRAIAPIEAEIRNRLGDHIYGADADTLESLVGALLRQAGNTLAVAESCTGGLLGHRLTNIPGSSDYFLGSLVTYSNQAKTDLLGVPAETITAHGAVSAETAQAMAEGVRRVCGADLGLSVTGIAGPTGGTAAKPVGLTYLGLAHSGGAFAEERRLSGDRLLIKERAAHMALHLLYRHLTGRPGGAS
jgi:nicotinamide-nucleotide amidase